jgi:hypothetical protein
VTITPGALEIMDHVADLLDKPRSLDILTAQCSITCLRIFCIKDENISDLFELLVLKRTLVVEG